MTATSLDGQLLRGLAWTGATRWLSQLVTWSCTFALARLLTPADYGLVGMAHLLLGLLAIVTEFGFAATVLTHQDLTDADLAEANGLAAILGVLGVLIAAAVAFPLGRFFGETALPLVVVALSVAFVVNAFRTIPEALLQRDLRFRALGVIEALQATIGAIATIAAALAGLSYWSLVFGVVVSQTMTTAITLWLRPCRFLWPSRKLLPLFSFSRDVLVGRLSWYAYENSDFLVAGRVLGPGTLGAYSFAWAIASVPVSRVGALVGRITPAFFSRLQDDRAALGRLLINTTEGLVLVVLPASLGLAVVADDLVPVLLGPQWDEVVVPLQLLAVCATFRCVSSLFPQVLVALRQTRLPMLTSVAMALLLPPSFLAGSLKGAPGIAAVWLLVYPLFIIPLAVRTFRLTGLTSGQYLAALWPAVRGAGLMVFVVLLVKWCVPSSVSALVRLGLQVGAGIVAFAIAGLLPNRDRIRNVIRLFRSQGQTDDLPS